MPNAPFTRPLCRYQVSVTAGIHTVTQNCADLEIAQGVLDRFAARNAGDRDAFGGIYDRETRSYVAKWSGAPKRKPLPTIADIYARLAQRALEGRGAPVSILSDRGAVEIDAAARTTGIAA